jgi:hypothetical protein
MGYPKQHLRHLGQQAKEKEAWLVQALAFLCEPNLLHVHQL